MKEREKAEHLKTNDLQKLFCLFEKKKEAITKHGFSTTITVWINYKKKKQFLIK